MLKRLLAVSAAMCLTVGSYAFATELAKDHPSVYTVQKGDTLWDIAGRFLQKPWQWPEIWQANPQIKNPHLIYPGDQISLAYLDGQPVLSSNGPQIRVGEPVDAVPLGQIKAFLKQMDVIGLDVKDLPYVIGLEEDQLIASSGQTVYVRGMANAKRGDRVRVVRANAQYFQIDPVADSLRTASNQVDFRGRGVKFDWETVWSEVSYSGDKYGRFLGHEVMTQAAGEVTQVRGDLAVVLLEGEAREVRVGDRILPAEDQPYDASYFPHPPAQTVDGARVLAVADGLRGAGTRSVVALAAGKADGVDNGTVFSIWSKGVVVPDRVKHGNGIAAKFDRAEMPDEFVGHVMVFRTFDNVSYGLVMDGIRPVAINDLLKHPDAIE